MSEDKMRAEFEEAITKDRMEAGYDEPNLSMIEWEGSQVYAENYIQAAWWGWQASRKALVVELPDSFDTYGYSAEVARVATDCCAEAIEAAGVKVKP